MQENWWSRLTSEDKSDEEMNSSTFVIYTERLFKIRQRKTTISREIKCGFLHFFSCSFILAVNPSLLQYAGFNAETVAAGTAVTAGVSCILSGFFSNLPFVLAPTTSTSLYFALFVQNQNLETKDGNFSVFILGILFMLCGFRPLALYISNCIPFVMKVGICLGVGLLIALESLIEIGLVRTGERTVLDIGEFDAEIYISMIAFVAIGLSLHFKIRGSFLVGLILGTSLFWAWAVVSGESGTTFNSSDILIKGHDVDFSLDGFSKSTVTKSMVYKLVFDLYIIGIILLNGLAHGLSEMTNVARGDGTLPRGKWLYAACGMGTLLASTLSCGPIMISPESAPGIKSGARTGLSAVVCGILFLFSTILCPVFAQIPASGTSPVLLMIGMMLFENAGKVNWHSVKEALPVFLMCVFIPFTYSIFNGVIFGFGIYAILYFVTEPDACSHRLRSIMCDYCCASNASGKGSSKKGGTELSVSGANESAYSPLAAFENEELCFPQMLSFELNEIYSTNNTDNTTTVELSGYHPLRTVSKDGVASNSAVNSDSNDNSLHSKSPYDFEGDDDDALLDASAAGGSHLSSVSSSGLLFGGGSIGNSIVQYFIGGGDGSSSSDALKHPQRRGSRTTSSSTTTGSAINSNRTGLWSSAASSSSSATLQPGVRPTGRGRGLYEPWGAASMGSPVYSSENNNASAGGGNTGNGGSSGSSGGKKVGTSTSNFRSINAGIGSLWFSSQTREKPDWVFDA
jgi:AGZA family xanthine/uracil permease-like MFS transporter